MAEFKPSFQIIHKMEGGYSNNPLDNGKETYCGISRRYHPDWGGWAFIDRMKAKGAIKNNTFFASLNPLVEGFYIKEFWNKMFLSFFSQDLANQLLDFAVNSGKGRAVKTLQAIMNRFGFRLKVDGVLGKNTANAVRSFDNSKLAELLFNEREKFIAILSQQQPAFAQAWRNRLNYLRGYISSPAVLFPLALVAVTIIALKSL
ncbi:hypothetical protein DWB61_03730 [Ancylomarina euxinus]|uniref:Uncharacterized protein n=1 Tax=Ancylomarina euxinus TaxID=2283627 RepID=A0A425Y714_9BACT|nr:glycosyl hydrolase 108 family protein [Ancylomarina euxinus]MBI9035468.1 hypothetical protein [Bacteroidales bacterium]MCZ4693889.1 hypothetical protein [Ancylomarina euxinus]MUP14691.1 hypothetical protein [Ancylomarina euxinus]RRG24236.1 hypothetical protein DWB61_03730 [Ancylomarina euxinus]